MAENLGAVRVAVKDDADPKLGCFRLRLLNQLVDPTRIGGKIEAGGHILAHARPAGPERCGSWPPIGAELNRTLAVPVLRESDIGERFQPKRSRAARAAATTIRMRWFVTP